MSAYASSIPGAHLIPYFAFGPLMVDEEDDDNAVEIEKTPNRRDEAPWTASFISGSQGVSPEETDDEINGKQEHGEEKNDDIGNGQDDEKSDTTPYTHGLCFEDTDSDDDEYSMYDYSEEFAQDQTGQATEDDDSRKSEEDPSAIEFEMEISYQGRTYTATRAFPLFVKLRNDLLRELNLDGGEGCELRHGMHYRRGQRCRQEKIGCQEQSVPELPRVSREENSHESFALSGVAKSGFALLRATANMYIPEMEKWLFEVANAFPCSQSLSSFLWEPLSTMSDESSTTSSCNGHIREKIMLGARDAPFRPRLQDSTGRPSRAPPILHRSAPDLCGGRTPVARKNRHAQRTPGRKRPDSTTTVLPSLFCCPESPTLDDTDRKTLRKRSETRVVLPVRDFILACPASSNQKMTERMEALKMIPLEGIDLISREQKNLTDTLSDLKSGIDSRVAREKSEMELAHRVVLNEKAIKTNKLQGEVDRLEEAVATNERANQLEVERDWFKRESLALSSQLGEAEDKIISLEGALEESKREREWLKEQLEKLNNKK
ncbi:hypothetical protein THAOC_16477 [Thalassiosira oceanica]|uniref:PX domain-containing protein n=1 Tax=Thalassiosira oceanica TaxID=159749 RepID=K0SD66_THAOC|nr:hypothetical protein THAOC_16477 [Thalassiosira oceanica]|eukprot:EJK62894.1 hypothetical protein THAOC_16477 [Thalassiosira oceanica]